MSYDADIIVDVSGHVDIDDKLESDDKEQPTGCISKLVFKNVMNIITVLEDYSLFSNFGAYLVKALKDVNGAFDFDCLSNKKQFTIKDCSKLCKHFIKKKDKKKKRTDCFLIPESL